MGPNNKDISTIKMIENFIEKRKQSKKTLEKIIEMELHAKSKKYKLDKK